MSGKSSGGQTSTQTTDPWSGQQPYLQDLFKQAQSYFGGERADVAPAQALGQEGVQRLTGAAEGTQPIIGGATEAQKRLTSGEFLSPESNPALQEYINASNKQIAQQYTENILPQITSGAAATGGIGSSRQGVAEGITAGKTLDAIQRNTAQQQTEAYAQGLKSYTAGVALAPQTAGLQQLPADMYALAAERQYGISALPQSQQLEYLQAYRDLVGGAQFGGTTTTTGPGTRTGGASGAIGGAAQGYAATGSWMGAAAGAVAGYFS